VDSLDDKSYNNPYYILELASLYKLTVPLSAVNGLSRLTTTSNGQALPVWKFANRPMTFESNRISKLRRSLLVISLETNPRFYTITTTEENTGSETRSTTGHWLYTVSRNCTTFQQSSIRRTETPKDAKLNFLHFLAIRFALLTAERVLKPANCT